MKVSSLTEAFLCVDSTWRESVQRVFFSLLMGQAAFLENITKLLVYFFLQNEVIKCKI